MTMMLRFDGVNDHVTIPTIPTTSTVGWNVEFKLTVKISADISILGASGGSPSNQRIQLRVPQNVIRVNGTSGISVDIPCPLTVNETATFTIVSTVSPERLTVFKNGVQVGQLTGSQPIGNFNYIGRTSFNYGQMDLYYLRVWYDSNDYLWSADGVTSGTTLPEVNNSANNGTLVNFSATPWVDDALFTLPSTITPLSDFTSTAIAPYVDGAATISFSGVSVSVTIASGQFTTQMPFITSGEVYPVLPLNGAVTLTQGANSSTIFRPIVIPPPYDRLRVDNDPEGAYGNFQYIETTDDKYIGYHITLTESDTWYFATTDGYSVDQDSGVNSDTAPRTDIGYQQNTTTGIATAHSITINPDGSIVVEDIGYSLYDIMKITLEGKGFSGSNTDMLLAWLKANGGTGLHIQDCQRAFLTARGITPDAALPDAWYRYFLGKGYTGALPEMWKRYWLSGAPL